jgi:triosephosphate isomerase
MKSIMNPSLVAGNWKMHCGTSEAAALAGAIANGAPSADGVEVAVAPPFTALAAAGDALKGSAVKLAAQNVHWEDKGAFTGEVSPAMLLELGCRFVIVGHSERRHLFYESDSLVANRFGGALRAGLRPILCVGETLQERRKGATMRVVGRQLRSALKQWTKGGIGKFDVAYEPVWAIGTGQNATPEQIRTVHRSIRNFLRQSFGSRNAAGTRILYGGSVKPENIGEIGAIAEVNGVLVGGASLQAEGFLTLVREFSSRAKREL